ncbi:hypothetical protein BaRGS_00002258 [Batillaria attramentaria]|uniref:Uncharacterized protein n=1 Tax=Batillaria attramentaria TaxID=370345 RepID=A0ABD0M4X1_9CAEN
MSQETGAKKIHEGKLMNMEKAGMRNYSCESLPQSENTTQSTGRDKSKIILKNDTILCRKCQENIAEMIPEGKVMNLEKAGILRNYRSESFATL